MRSVRTRLCDYLFIFILVGCLVSCASRDDDLLQVRHYHLQDVDPVDRDAEMSRGEQFYRSRGAVTMEERKSRLGHYYTVEWARDQMGAGEMKVVMDYQQAATASKVLRMSRDLPDDVEAGKIEFHITGENYRVGGRVLAWRVQLFRGSRVIAEKRSYLWK